MQEKRPAQEIENIDLLFEVRFDEGLVEDLILIDWWGEVEQEKRGRGVQRKFSAPLTEEEEQAKRGGRGRAAATVYILGFEGILIVISFVVY